MDNVINIKDLLKSLKQLDAEDIVTIDFLSGIEEYAALLLSEKAKIDKLILSFGIHEKVKPLFYNKVLFLSSDELSKGENEIRDILIRIRTITDNYFGLIEKDQSKEKLQIAINLYKKQIVELVKKYTERLKSVIHDEIVDEFKQKQSLGNK